MRENGDFESRKWTSTNLAAGPVKCQNGLAKVVPGDAKQTYRCSNVSDTSKKVYDGANLRG